VNEEAIARAGLQSQTKKTNNTIDGSLATDSFVGRYLSPTLIGNIAHDVVVKLYCTFFQIPPQSAIK
jgi:hypothetical protein